MVGAAEVDAYFAALEHSLKATMEAVRREILAADRRMTESIKWQSPTFDSDPSAQLRAGTTSRASTRERSSS